MLPARVFKLYLFYDKSSDGSFRRSFVLHSSNARMQRSERYHTTTQQQKKGIIFLGERLLPMVIISMIVFLSVNLNAPTANAAGAFFAVITPLPKALLP